VTASLSDDAGENGDPTLSGRGFDPATPRPARMWNYWVGGKDHFAVDRAAAETITEVMPALPPLAKSVRVFLREIVHSLAADYGIRQFLDIGTGLPTADNTHEVAQRAVPEARIVYADYDPSVLAHARALLTSGPQGVTGYLDADARDPDTILAQASSLLDFEQPVAVMLVALLHCIDDADDPSGLVATLMRAVAPGSFLVISHPPSDMQQQAPGLAEHADKLSALMAQKVTPRSREQVSAFFDGLELVEPGVVPIQQWRPDNDAEATARAGMWGGVGRKP